MDLVGYNYLLIINLLLLNFQNVEQMRRLRRTRRRTRRREEEEEEEGGGWFEEGEGHLKTEAAVDLQSLVT